MLGLRDKNTIDLLRYSFQIFIFLMTLFKTTFKTAKKKMIILGTKSCNLYAKLKQKPIMLYFINHYDEICLLCFTLSTDPAAVFNGTEQFCCWVI